MRNTISRVKTPTGQDVQFNLELGQQAGTTPVTFEYILLQARKAFFNRVGAYATQIFILMLMI